MLRILVWLLLLLVFLAGVIFTLYNPHPITLYYVLGDLQIRLAILVLFSLIMGAVLGVLFSLHWAMKLRYQNHRLRKAQQQSTQEIEQLNAQLRAQRAAINTLP